MRFSASIVLALFSATTFISAFQFDDSDHGLYARRAEPEIEDLSIYAREASPELYARDLLLIEKVVTPLRKRGWAYGQCMASGGCRLPHGVCTPSPNPCSNYKNKDADCQCLVR